MIVSCVPRTSEFFRIVAPCSILLAITLLLHGGFELSFHRPAAEPDLLQPSHYPIRESLSEVVAGLRILLVSHYLSPSGAPKLVAELAHLLIQASANVTVSVLPLLQDGTLRRALDSGDWHTASSELRNQLRRLSDSPLLERVTVMPDLRDASQHDVIIAHTMHPKMIDWINQFRSENPWYKRFIWWIHEGKAGAELLGGIDRTIDIIRKRRVDALAWESWGGQQFWTGAMVDHRHFGSIPTPARMIHWGMNNYKLERIDEARRNVIAQQELRNALGVSESDVVFVMLSSHTSYKGVPEAIAAFGKSLETCPPSIGRAHMVIAGAGFWPGYLDYAGLQRYHAVVHVLSPTSTPEDILAIGDVFISNALNGGENWGLSCLEAMAAGLPILATKGSGGLEQVEPDGNGLHHDMEPKERNLEQLSENICRLMSDRETRLRMGNASRRRVEGVFNEQVLNDELSDLLYYTLREPQIQPEREVVLVGPWTEVTHPLPARVIEFMRVEHHDRSGKTEVYLAGGLPQDSISREIYRWTTSHRGWSRLASLPQGAADSHSGAAFDGRFLFLISGQVGRRCNEATRRSLAFDTVEDSFIELAPLPKARFMPEAAIITHEIDPTLPRGHVVLHVFGGFEEDRVRPSRSHWRMIVRTEDEGSHELIPLAQQQWLPAPDIPLPTGHGASAIVGQSIFLIGGLRDHVALRCDPSTEIHKWHPIYGDSHSGGYHHSPVVQRYDLVTQRWHRMADMPMQISHFAMTRVRDKLITLGGTLDRDMLVSAIQVYDARRDEWQVNRQKLPHNMKNGFSWVDNGTLYYAGGHLGDEDHRPVSRVVTNIWKAAYISRD